MVPQVMFVACLQRVSSANFCLFFKILIGMCLSLQFLVCMQYDGLKTADSEDNWHSLSASVKEDGMRER